MLRSLIVTHPTSTYVLTVPILALFALSPTPHFLPIVVLLTSLRLWTWSFTRRARFYWRAALQTVAISIAGGVTSLAPSLQALSTPTTSIVVLSLISAIASATALAILVTSNHLGRLASTPWTKFTIFPALWASTWGFLSYVSPVGQLATWSPVSGLGPYRWLRPVLGQWGIDWVAGAWAVVLSEALGDWIVGSPDHPSIGNPEITSIVSDDAHTPEVNAPQTGSSISHQSYVRLGLVASLLALTLPSYVLLDEPRPPNSIDTTPFAVGCAIPITRHTGKHVGRPTLDDYLHESTTLQPRANIVLWPEGAVRFDSLNEKEAAFSKIQKRINGGKYFGVTFEDYVPAGVKDGVFQPEQRHNGLALLGSTGPPVLQYYKRNLVPFVESYPLTPGHTPPAILTIDLPPPKSYNKSDWAPPPYTRPIPITGSICLDFSAASTFTHLESKPALILAPASTWHSGIGHAMWEQARARADETGGMILWCDGGEGGVSGVIGGGYNDIVQVGQGSWTKAIGIQYPFDQRRTFFVFGGEYAALVGVWGILGIGWAVEMIFVREAREGTSRVKLFAIIGRIADRVRPLFRAKKPDEERPLLE